MARLSFLLPDLSGGGAERVTLLLVDYCLAQGHEVDLVVLNATGELKPLLPPAVQLFDLGASRLLAALRPLTRYFRERRPSSIHAAMWPLTIIALIAKRLSGVKARIIVSDHTILSQQYCGSRRAMAALRLTTRLFYPLADGRVCVSHGSADDLAQLSGLERRKFTVIHNPMPPAPDPIGTNKEAEALWRDAKTRILTVGNLKEAKNHALLIEALAKLDRKRRPRMLILGEGQLRASLERQAECLGVSDQVAMPGFVVDPWPFYASADLFVLSSDREGLGNSLIEAMLAGLPVISTDCTGPRETLDNGRFGCLVPCGDAAALAGAIEQALDSAHDVDAARERAEQLSDGASGTYLRMMLEGTPGKGR